MLKYNRQTTAWRHWPGAGSAAPRRIILAGLAALMAIAIVQAGVLTVAPAAAQTIVNISDGQRVGKITVSVGQSETLRLSEPYENIVIGNPGIADVAPLTDQTLYLLGNAIGTTNLAVYDAASELIAVIDVEVTSNVRGLREALAAALPGQPIQIRSVGGRVMLQGAVLDATMVDRAMQIAQDFAGETAVTNALTVASPQQVMLEVRMIEAQRTPRPRPRRELAGRVQRFQVLHFPPLAECSVCAPRVRGHSVRQHSVQFPGRRRTMSTC
jgi:pilus assembly protein CpaC